MTISIRGLDNLASAIEAASDEIVEEVAENLRRQLREARRRSERDAPRNTGTLRISPRGGSHLGAPAIDEERAQTLGAAWWWRRYRDALSSTADSHTVRFDADEQAERCWGPGDASQTSCTRLADTDAGLCRPCCTQVQARIDGE